MVKAGQCTPELNPAVELATDDFQLFSELLAVSARFVREAGAEETTILTDETASLPPPQEQPSH